ETGPNSSRLSAGSSLLSSNAGWRTMVSKNALPSGMRPLGAADGSPLGKISISPFGSSTTRKFPPTRTSSPRKLHSFQSSLGNPNHFGAGEAPRRVDAQRRHQVFVHPTQHLVRLVHFHGALRQAEVIAQ